MLVMLAGIAVGKLYENMSKIFTYSYLIVERLVCNSLNNNIIIIMVHIVHD